MAKKPRKTASSVRESVQVLKNMTGNVPKITPTATVAKEKTKKPSVAVKPAKPSRGRQTKQTVVDTPSSVDNRAEITSVKAEPTSVAVAVEATEPLLFPELAPLPPKMEREIVKDIEPEARPFRSTSQQDLFIHDVVKVAKLPEPRPSKLQTLFASFRKPVKNSALTLTPAEDDAVLVEPKGKPQKGRYEPEVVIPAVTQVVEEIKADAVAAVVEAEKAVVTDVVSKNVREKLDSVSEEKSSTDRKVTEEKVMVAAAMEPKQSSEAHAAKPSKHTRPEAIKTAPLPVAIDKVPPAETPKPVVVSVAKPKRPKPENLITLDQIKRNAEAKKKEIDEKIISLKDADTKKKEAAMPLSSKPTLATKNDTLGLHIRNLGKSYGDKPAVRDVSMVLHRGEAVGLLGPNGAGKTTTFYMIMGLIKPDYGTILLDGKDMTHLPVYRRARMGIGYLPQEASIFRGMTVEENILSVLELSEPVVEKRHGKLESLLGEFSITHLRRSPAIALSGGERRRVEIARALASNPAFILLDEPLAGIDPVAIADIKQLIFHLKNRGIGVLITDHNVRDALDLINRAYIIHDGKVLMEGAPKEIVGNEEVRRVYLGEGFVL